MPDAAQRTFASQAIPTPDRFDSLYDVLRSQAQRDPQAVAILAPGRSPLRFGALIEQIDAVRAALDERNLTRSDRIAVLGSRGSDAAVAILGVSCHGVCAPLNAPMPSAETEQALRDIRASALLVMEPAGVGLRDLAERLGVVLLEYATDSAGRLEIVGNGKKVRREANSDGAFEAAFLLRTSGTTSRSKIVPVSQRNLMARIANTRRLFALTPADRCLSVMPLCYEHGLFTGLLGPLGSGGSVICAPAFDSDTFFACLRDLEATWYSGSFTYHHAIHDWLEKRPDAATGHRLRFARTSSGSLPVRVQTALERMLGVPLIEAYGCTETGTVAANRPEGPRKSGSAGKPIDDDVAILGEDGSVVTAGTTGEVALRGPRVFDGYDNDSEANERVFRHGWYHTGDHGYMDSDGFIWLLGRIDDLVNHGGEKIAPQEVDNVLMQHPAVAIAISFPVPHPRLGQELAAAVVLRPDQHVAESALQRFVAERIAAFKVPRRIFFRADLPKGPTGKLSRKAMAERFGLQGGPPLRDSARAQSGLQQALTELWCEVLNRSDIGADSNFFLCGGDSLMALDLLCRIEERLHTRLPLGALIEAPTPRQIEAALESASYGTVGSTIAIHGTGTRRPLFMVGDRGGHIIRLLPLMHALPDQPSFALQPPGLDWTPVGCTTLPQMARHYIERLRSIQPGGPYRLFGPSFGGIVVFEMARQLEAAGERVEFLGLVDTSPPQCLFAGERAAPVFMNKMPQEDDSDSIEAMNIRLAWTHVRARQSYALDIPSHRLASTMTYFYCTGEAVQALHDRRRLWAQLAPNGFRLVPIAGLHGSYHGEPQLADLQHRLTQALDACNGGPDLPSCAPSDVFDRGYRLHQRWTRREIITSLAGKACTVDRTATAGQIESVNIDDDGLIVSGWAIEPPQQPAQTIVAFLDREYLGYGACGQTRPDVAREVGASLHYAGFRFRFLLDPQRIGRRSLRLFVLTADGRANKLRNTS